MPGSSLSVAGPNIVLNTAVAEEVRQFADALEGTPSEDMEKAVRKLLKKAISDHKRIIFNGNGYTDEWVEEAKRRGLYNLKALPDAMPYFIAPKNVELFTKHHIFTEGEIHARYDILLENYSKAIHVESKTMVEMLQKDLMPPLLAFTGDTAQAAAQKKAFAPSISTASEEKLVAELSSLYDTLAAGVEKLAADTAQAEHISDPLEAAIYYCRTVLEQMNTLRVSADKAESLIPDTYLPYPTYDELLFSV